MKLTLLVTGVGTTFGTLKELSLELKFFDIGAWTYNNGRVLFSKWDPVAVTLLLMDEPPMLSTMMFELSTAILWLSSFMSEIEHKMNDLLKNSNVRVF